MRASSQGFLLSPDSTPSSRIMLTRLEKFVLHVGLDVLHMRAAALIYLVYVIWNVSSVLRLMQVPGSLPLTLLYVDVVDILLVMMAAYCAVSGKLWMERITVFTMGVSVLAQQLLCIIHSVLENAYLPREAVLGGLLFAILFGTRGLTLTYKIAVLRSRLIQGGA